MKDFSISVRMSGALRKIRHTVNFLQKVFSSKIILKNKTILINSSLWDFFSFEDFDNCVYDFVRFDTNSRIDEKSLCNAVAYIGHIDKRLFKENVKYKVASTIFAWI